MRTSVIMKSTPKFFSASCVLFMMAGFTSEKINCIFRSAIQVLWPDVMIEYMHFVDDDSN